MTLRQDRLSGCLSSVVEGAGAGLVAPSSPRPAESVREVWTGLSETLITWASITLMTALSPESRHARPTRASTAATVMTAAA
ncbi:hypothetical protein [Streptomyces sp. NPDC003996]